MLFGSCHLILFVSSTNYFQRVRRQCCLALSSSEFSFLSQRDMISSGALNIICQFLLDILLTTTWYQLCIHIHAVKHITFDIKMLFSDSYFWTRRVASGDTFHLGAGCDWELELKCWKTRKSPFLSNFPLIVLQLEMWIEMDWFEPLLQLMKTLSESSKGANSLFSFQHNCYIVWGAWVLKAIKNVMWWLKMFWNLWSLLTQTGLPGANWLSVTSPSVHLLWLTEPLRISREALDSFS